MFKKLSLSLFIAAMLSASLATAQTHASAEPSLKDDTQQECSDPGRSCSVSRNCCSGSCTKGTCD